MSKATLVFSIGQNELRWGTSIYKAVSGPHGKGALPVGEYVIEIRNIVCDPDASTMGPSFQAPSGRAWMQHITPNFATDRARLGIHPDGGSNGTAGCIGLQGDDGDIFWYRWTALPTLQRPTELEVIP